MKGSDFGAGDSKPKDPNLVVGDGQKKDITEGTQYFDFEIPAEVVDEKKLYFCFVTEDEKGNQGTFDYYEIPETVVSPEPEPEQGEYEIVSITGEIQDRGGMLGTGHELTITMNKNETGFGLFGNTDIRITGNGQTISGYQKISVACSSDKPEDHIVSLINTSLKPGEYTVEITLDKGKITKNIQVADDGKGTVTLV